VLHLQCRHQRPASLSLLLLLLQAAGCTVHHHPGPAVAMTTWRHRHVISSMSSRQHSHCVRCATVRAIWREHTLRAPGSVQCIVSLSRGQGLFKRFITFLITHLRATKRHLSYEIGITFHPTQVNVSCFNLSQIVRGTQLTYLEGIKAELIWVASFIMRCFFCPQTSLIQVYLNSDLTGSRANCLLIVILTTQLLR